MLDRDYPRQFIVEMVKGDTSEVRIRRRGGPDFADEDIVGFYNLDDSTLTLDMILEDVDYFLTQGIQ